MSLLGVPSMIMESCVSETVVRYGSKITWLGLAWRALYWTIARTPLWNLENSNWCQTSDCCGVYDFRKAFEVEISIWSSSRFSSIMADGLPNRSNSILGSKRPALNCSKLHLQDSPRVSIRPNVVGLVHQWPIKYCYFFWLCFYVRGWHHRLLHWGHCW